MQQHIWLASCLHLAYIWLCTLTRARTNADCACMRAVQACGVGAACSGALRGGERASANAQGCQGLSGGVHCHGVASRRADGQRGHPAAAQEFCRNAAKRPCHTHLRACPLLAACPRFSACLLSLRVPCASHVPAALQALRKLDFRPPEPFVVACANFTGMKLEGAVTGAIAPSTLEVATISKLISGLVAWKFSPPPPMLMMVRPAVLPALRRLIAASLSRVLQHTAVCPACVHCAGTGQAGSLAGEQGHDGTNGLGRRHGCV
jgi:hypothetical protein